MTSGRLVVLTAHEAAGAPLRADAQQNYDRLVGAASRAFARHGADASLKAIAADAGVGIGTLYRRFPCRERLVEAVYRSKLKEICDKATGFIEASTPPAQAMRVWLASLVEFLMDKDGMTAALKPVLQGEDAFRVETLHQLTDAVDSILQAAPGCNGLRTDVNALDILRSAGGIAYVCEDSTQAGRLLDLLMDGLQKPWAGETSHG